MQKSTRLSQLEQLKSTQSIPRKQASSQAIDDALKAKEAEIDSRTDLTDEEKAAAKVDAKGKQMS